MTSGLRSVCSAWRSSERKLPAQFRRKFKAALKTVGVLKASSRPVGRHVVGVGAGTVSSYIVAGHTTVRVIVRQALVAE